MLHLRAYYRLPGAATLAPAADCPLVIGRAQPIDVAPARHPIRARFADWAGAWALVADPSMRHPGGDNPMPDAVALDQANNGPILRHMPQIVPSGATAHHAQIVRPERNFDGARVGSVDGRRREVRHCGRHRATPERSQQNANSSGTAIPLLLLAPIWQLDHFLMSR